MYWCPWRTICFQDVARSSLLIFLALSQCSFLFYFFLLGNSFLNCCYGTEPHILAQISLIGLATYLHVIVFLVITELILTVCTMLSKCGVFTLVVRRITTNRHKLTLLSIFCAFIFIIAGIYETFTDPVYTHVSIPLKKLHFDELRVALLSDLHIGPTVGRQRIETIARLTNKLNPDIIAISGDLADGFVENFGNAASPLCSLRAKYGVYFATGNHEYMHGNVEEWFTFLEVCNITVLHNLQQRFRLTNGTDVCIAGADDLFAAKSRFPGHIMDPRKAVNGCRTNDIVVMLAHQPNAARLMLNDPAVNNKLDVILSGA
ncbi:Ser/Thr phosphatase family protein [Dictyocaulus viviparus]|uniref:Ser/Thr phosphatase family protein n=1 Tax=Dictyocaulus viviparus TaxID=29172 RepID=A0A0D8XL78_DICVI|nr:Ser/Thr phosphatase family protein [Dictyocaulus viviparus]